MNKFQANSILEVIIRNHKGGMIRKDKISLHIDGDIKTDEYRFDFKIENDWINSKLIINHETRMIVEFDTDDFYVCCSRDSLINQDPTDIKNLLQYAHRALLVHYYDACYPDFSIDIQIVEIGEIIPFSRVFKGTIKVNGTCYELKVVVDVADYFYEITVFFDDKKCDTIKSYKLTEEQICPEYLLSVAYMFLINRNIDEKNYIDNYNIKVIEELKEEE